MKEKVTKDKIATYLHDFFITMYNANKMKYKSSASFYDIYNNYLVKSGRNYESNIDEYHKMINFIIFFSVIREFSILYDNFFPYIREEDLKDMDFDSIFVNPCDKELFKGRKRDIVTYIRNALNHNDNNDLCSFSYDVDGDYNVEINLRNTNPPFNVELDYPQILEIIYRITFKARRCDITLLKRDSKNKIPSYDYNYLDQIKTLYLTRIHTKTKNGLTEEQKKAITDLHNQKNSTSKDIIDKIKDDVEIYDYHLSWEQVYAIHDKFECLKSVAKELGSNTDVLINDDMLKSVLYNTIPLGIFKVDMIEYYLHVLLNMSNSNMTLLNASAMARNESLKQGKLFESTSNSWLYYLIDNVTNPYFAAGLYFGYIFDSVIKDDEVLIGGKKYNKNKIRNSFVHMRNYFSDKKFYLYDLSDTNSLKNAKKIINELNQKLIGSFTTDELVNCVDAYYKDLVQNASVDIQNNNINKI